MELKSTAQKVWAFIKSQIFLALIVIVLSVYASIEHNKVVDLKREATISEQNQLAFKDSLKIERMKNGAMQTSIAGYVASEKELKTLNKQLYDKVKAQSGEVIALNNAVIKLVQDTTELRAHINKLESVIGDLIKIDSNTFIAPWTLSYKWDAKNSDVFQGNTTIKIISRNPLTLKHFDTEMIKRTTTIDLTWGEKVENGKYRVFIQSSYPGFTVEQLSGVLIDPNDNKYIKSLMKKKHWFQGFSIGLGAAAGYNLTGGGYGFVIGPTVSWNIYTF